MTFEAVTDTMAETEPLLMRALRPSTVEGRRQTSASDKAKGIREGNGVVDNVDSFLAPPFLCTVAEARVTFDELRPWKYR